MDLEFCIEGLNGKVRGEIEEIKVHNSQLQ